MKLTYEESLVSLGTHRYQDIARDYAVLVKVHHKRALKDIYNALNGSGDATWNSLNEIGSPPASAVAATQVVSDRVTKYLQNKIAECGICRGECTGAVFTVRYSGTKDGKHKTYARTEKWDANYTVDDVQNVIEEDFQNGNIDDAALGFDEVEAVMVLDKKHKAAVTA
jgi:hypothetical protein